MIDITDSELRQLSEYIHQKYGIYLKEQKRTLVTGRLSSVLEKHGFGSFSEYLSLIKNDPTGEEEKTLINQITTNYTYFMREPSHFHYLRETVLPTLEAGVKDCDLRIWSAGCSSGEEPYTLAFILDEYFKNKNWWDKKVLATDISEKALDKARRGVYERGHLDDLPPQWRLDYFDRLDDNNMAVKEHIKKQVIFAPLNLIGGPFNFKRQFHIIMCRNVMIYFDQKTKVELVNRFYDITAPGGYLFIGHTESIASWESKYRYVMPALYRKI